MLLSHIHLVVALVALVASRGATRVMQAGLACPELARSAMQLPCLVAR